MKGKRHISRTSRQWEHGNEEGKKTRWNNEESVKQHAWQNFYRTKYWSWPGTLSLAGPHPSMLSCTSGILKGTMHVLPPPSPRTTRADDKTLLYFSLRLDQN
jgi:hypothetical protein